MNKPDPINDPAAFLPRPPPAFPPPRIPIVGFIGDDGAVTLIPPPKPPRTPHRLK